jgi:hypothetical protein
MCPYIPRLTEEYRAIGFLVNRGRYWFFYITLILVASLDGEPPKQVIQHIYIVIHVVFTQQGINQWQSIVFTQQYIVIILRHKYITYNSITMPCHCWCHHPCPHQILPCLETDRWSHVQPMKKDAWRHKMMSKRVVQHLLILWIEHFNVGIYDLQSVAKKKVNVTVVSVSSTEKLPTAWLALQLEVTTVATSIPG